MNYGELKNLDIANGPGCRVSLFVSVCKPDIPHSFCLFTKCKKRSYKGAERLTEQLKDTKEEFTSSQINARKGCDIYG